MSHGLRPQAGWDPAASAEIIEAKAQDLAKLAGQMRACLGRGETALVRDRLPLASSAFQQINCHLVLLRHALGVGAGERADGA